MSSWWVDTPEARRVLAEERAVVHAAELVSAGLERRGLLRKVFAERLGIKASELSQRLSGRRNMTIRSLAAMAHELDCELELQLRPLAVHTPAGRSAVVSHRASAWPKGNLGYTQTGVALRGISGVA
jgi:transcriptional regulator with XRE-family HTH domain